MPRARGRVESDVKSDPIASAVRRVGRMHPALSAIASAARPRSRWIALAFLLAPACGTPHEPASVAPTQPSTSTMPPALTADSAPEPDVTVLARFDAAEVARWSAFDDVIMGGVSSSRMSGEDGHGVFTGVVSLENEGGFASVRSSARDWGLGGARGLVLRVRGDGQRYKVNARTNDGMAGGSWQGAFATRKGEWITVRIPFAEFVPRLRGQSIDAGPLDPAAVRTLGLLITDKQAGPFRLDVAWIGVWRDEARTTRP